MPFSHLSLIALAVSSILTQPTYANTIADDSIEKITVSGDQYNQYKPSSTNVASKLGILAKETPQAISVVGQQQIKDFALSNMNEVLNNTAAINVEQIETDRTYYNARGFAVNNIQIDGLGLPLINDNTHGQMDMALYDQVEIVRGANGIMTGAGSPSATISLKRKRPTTDLMVNFSTTFGSWDKQRFESDISGAITDSLRARAVLSQDKSESYLDRYSTNSQLVYGVLDYAFNEDTLITFGHSEHSNQSKGNLWGALTLYYGDGTATDYAINTNTSANWSRWDVNESRSFIDFSHNISPDWQLRLMYNRVRTDEDSELFYTYLTDSAVGLDPKTGLGLTGYASEYDINDKQDMFDAYVSGSFNAFGRTHELVVGASYARLDYIDVSLYDFHTGNGFPTMPRIEDFTGNTPYPEFIDGLTGGQVENTQTSAYLSARFNLVDGLHLLTGMRYNRWQTQGESYNKPQLRDDDKVVPYLGLTYVLTDAITAYSSYTETFMSQKERDANWDLIAPLTGQATEVGIKADLFDGDALLTAAWFDIKQVNLAIPAAKAPNPVTGIEEDVYKAADGISSKGIEFEVAGKLSDTLNGVVGLTDFAIDGDEQVSAYTVKRSVDISLTWSPTLLDGLRFGVNAKWQEAIWRNQGVVSALYANAGQEIITHQPAVTRINLMASYDINKHLALAFNANNITNKKYLNSLQWAQGFYAPPQHYSVSLNWAF